MQCHMTASLAAGGARWGYHQDTKIFEQEFLDTSGFKSSTSGGLCQELHAGGISFAYIVGVLDKTYAS